MTYPTDPADRLRDVRNAIAAQGRLTPRTDANGHPLPMAQQPRHVANHLWSNGVREHVARVAGDRAGELLDVDTEEGAAFIDSLDPLVELDPSAEGFAAAVAERVSAFTTVGATDPAGTGVTPPIQAGPRAPRPDPSQGARGGPPATTYASELEKAKAEGRTRDWLSLLNHPINESRKLGISVQEWHQRYGHHDLPPAA